MAKHLRPFLSVSVAAFSTLYQAGCGSPVRSHGHSSFVVYDPEPPPSPPPSAVKEADPSDTIVEYIAGYPKKNVALPLYPAAALSAHTGDYIVFVSVAIDETGHVTSVDRSWKGISPLNPFSEQFLDAVKSAVATWQFEPSHKVYYKRGANREREYVSTVAIAESIELKFTFTALGEVK